MLSYAYWQARYGGQPNVIGQSMRIGPVPCTIIGVAPEGFVGIPNGGAPVAFIPSTLYAYGVSLQRGRIDYHTTYNWGWLSVVVRRKAGVTATRSISRSDQRLSPQLGGRARDQPHCRCIRRPAPCDRRADRARPRSSGRAGGEGGDLDRRRRHDRPVHRVRQRRQPPPGSGTVAPARDRAAGGARREPAPPHRRSS